MVANGCTQVGKEYGLFLAQSWPGQQGRMARCPFSSNRSWSCLNDRVPVPVGFDDNKCEKVFHKSDCSYTVVEKNNPGKSCPVKSWVL